jgi:hypothetical protein
MHGPPEEVVVVMEGEGARSTGIEGGWTCQGLLQSEGSPGTQGPGLLECVLLFDSSKLALSFFFSSFGTFPLPSAL